LCSGLARILKPATVAHGHCLGGRRLWSFWRRSFFLHVRSAVMSPRDDLGFFFAAQLTDRNRFNPPPALSFDDLRPRTLVDHGLAHHLNLRDVDRLVDEGGVINDHGCRSDRIEKPLLAHKDERLRHKCPFVNLDHAAGSEPGRWGQWRPTDVSSSLSPGDPGRRPLGVRHPKPAQFHAPVPAAIVVSGPTPRLIAGPVPAGVGPLPVAVAVWTPSDLHPAG